MKLGILALAITSSMLLSACKTNVQFGNPEPNETPVMHNDWGNTYDNQKLNVLAPISENTQQEEKLESIKIVQPKNLRPQTNITAHLNITPESFIKPAPAPVIEKLAQPAPSNWQPNEAQLIRSNELLTGLQKEVGRKPTLPEMQKRLQTHMGLSAIQAQQVIMVLGLL